MMFAVFDNFASYSSALHTSLAWTQGFSLIVTTHNSTALKENGTMKDIFICSSFWSKNFCIRSPDTKKANVHTFLIDVIVIFSWVLGPILEVRFRNELCQLPLMSAIFSTAKASYNISGLGGLAIFKCLTHFPGTCPRFFIDGHNVQRDRSF